MALSCVLDRSRDMWDESIVVFSLGQELFSIPSNIVQAVEPLGNYVPLPFAHPFIGGVFKRDGRFLIILDIRALVTHVYVAPDPSALVMIVTLAEKEVVFLTDGIMHAHKQSRCVS